MAAVGDLVMPQPAFFVVVIEILVVSLLSRYLMFRTELRLIEYGYQKEPVNHLRALAVGGAIALGFGVGVLVDIYFVPEGQESLLGFPLVGAGAGAIISYIVVDETP